MADKTVWSLNKDGRQRKDDAMPELTDVAALKI